MLGVISFRVKEGSNHIKKLMLYFIEKLDSDEFKVIKYKFQNTSESIF